MSKNAWVEMCEELSESFDSVHDGEMADAYNRGLEAAQEIIYKYKQSFERPQAKWIPYVGGYAKCNACHSTFRDVYDEKSYNSFCRNCGAIMIDFDIPV